MESEKEPLVHPENYSTYSTIPDIVINNSEEPGGEPEITYKYNGVTVTKTTQELNDFETKIYKRRWYMLLVFALVAFSQGCCWNTWGPIAESSEEAYGWSDADIALLSNWGPIAYVVGAYLFSWILDVKGLRVATLSTIFLIAAGAGLRCVTDKLPYVTWLVHTGQFLIGLGGPVSMGGMPALSVTWFPPHERTTATAMMSATATIGTGVSFIIGPYMVSAKPPDNNTDKGNSSANSTMFLTEIRHEDITDKSIRIKKERNQIMKLMYIEAGFNGLLLLIVLFYFPAKPKLPPSVTASMERLDFKTGGRRLLRNLKFWNICLIYGVSLGVFYCWQSVLDVNLKPHNISEDEAGWLGFYSMTACFVSALVVGKFADVFSKHMKFFLLILNIGGGACFVWFTLLVNSFIPNSVVSLYISIILGTLLLNATPSLYFETACEVTYPIAEGITNMMLTMINSAGGLVFLLVQMVPNIGTAWENWCLIGAIMFCIPLLCVMKERYHRLEIDENYIGKDDKDV